MTIQESYRHLIERLHLPANEEKYSHLVISPNKTEEEELLCEYILRVGDYMKQIETHTVDNKTPKALLESGCRILLPKIEEILNKNHWK